jgi:hypothetical protein
MTKMNLGYFALSCQSGANVTIHTLILGWSGKLEEMEEAGRRRGGGSGGRARRRERNIRINSYDKEKRERDTAILSPLILKRKRT